jgi:hypothetical protein
MYNYRFTSFFAFTSMFWFVEVIFAAAAWGLSTTFLSSKPSGGSESVGDDVSVKDEGESLGVVKKEEHTGRSSFDYPPAAEADDEDDEIANQSLVGIGTLRVSDSGLGTSLESGDPIRRRAKPVSEGS